VFVPTVLETKLLNIYHDSPAVGHPGVARTLSTLLQTFSWPQVNNLVIIYVKSCDLCQCVKAQRLGKQVQLVSIFPNCKAWSTIVMDMINKLPLLGGYDSFLVFIDLLSKLTHFLPFKEASLSAVLANTFQTNLFCLHGIPDKIILDQGSTFVSDFCKRFMNSLNIKAGFSSAYYPQTDRQTERMNQVLEDYSRQFCLYYQDNWVKNLNMVKFSINNLNSASLGVSPFFFTYGHHPKFNILTESSGHSHLD
jgi:hypothetical protein